VKSGARIDAADLTVERGTAYAPSFFFSWLSLARMKSRMAST
jgi:hypothetical protein